MADLATLALVTGAFVGSHLLLSHPLRAPLVARMGERGFLGLYVFIAFLTFVPLVWARYTVEDDRLIWIAPPGAWDVATLLMLFVAILLMGSMKSNPAMPDPTGALPPIGQARGVFAITRHPMMWSFALWALIHLWLWGSFANIIVAGGILILALAGAAGQDVKKLRLHGERWQDWMNRTSFIPFVGQFSGRIPWRSAAPGWRATIIGVIFWLAATWVHVPLGGPEAGIWRWLR